MDVSPYFSKKFWKREFPVWQGLTAGESLGEAKMTGTPRTPKLNIPKLPTPPPKTDSGTAAAGGGASGFGSLFFGLLLGFAGYAAYLNRKKIVEAVSRARGVK
jgi:hypothetical protein